MFASTLSRSRGVFSENRVLRNTFILLAVSMIPTVLGALFGIVAGFPAFAKSSPWLFFIGSLVLAGALMFGVMAASETALGPVLFLTFTGVFGMILSVTISTYLVRDSGGLIIAQAAIGTMAIMIVCSIVAMMGRDLSSWGNYLFAALLGLIVVSLVGMFFQSSVLHIIISAVAVVLFSLYLIYDVNQVVHGGERNYVLAALSIYLDIINIFSHLLSLLGSASDD